MTSPADPFTPREDRAALKAAVQAIVEVEGGLSRERAEQLAAINGCSARTIYRYAAPAGSDPSDNSSSSTPESPGSDLVSDEEDTFLLRLMVHGSAGFVMDDLFWDLYYFCGGNMSWLRREVIGFGLPMPSEPTLSRLLKKESRMVRRGATHGLHDRSNHLLYIRHSASEANEAWQVDEMVCDIDVLDPLSGTKKRIQPHLVLFIDDYSRFITAWAALPGAITSEDFLCALADGIEVKQAENDSGALIGGAPDGLLFDNAQAFRSTMSTECLATLPITAKLSPPYTPTTKGKVERVNQTIQGLVVTAQPGVRSRSAAADCRDMLGVDDSYLMSFETFVELVAQAIHAYNYEHVHSAIQARPIDRYADSGIGARVIDEARLALMWLPEGRDGGRRLVHTTGIKVTRPAKHQRFYQSKEFLELIGESVEVRRQHHRNDRVAVFLPSPSGKPLSPAQFVAFATIKPTQEERDELVASRKSSIDKVKQLADAARNASEVRSLIIERGTDNGLAGGALDALIVARGMAVPGARPDSPEKTTPTQAVEAETAPAPSKMRPGRRRTTRRSTKSTPETSSPTSRGGRRSTSPKQLEVAMASLGVVPGKPMAGAEVVAAKAGPGAPRVTRKAPAKRAPKAGAK